MLHIISWMSWRFCVKIHTIFKSYFYLSISSVVFTFDQSLKRKVCCCRAQYYCIDETEWFNLNIWHVLCVERPWQSLSSCPPQVAVTVGLQYVHSSLSTLANPEDMESESEGYLLEKTVKETFTDIMTKMKTMGKGAKVEEGGEEPVATVSWANPPPTCRNWANFHLAWRQQRGVFSQTSLCRHYLLSLIILTTLLNGLTYQKTS